MRNLSVLSILFLLMLPFVSSGQTDTVYYDADWKVSDFGSAEFYRVRHKLTNGRVQVEDRYVKNDKLQMTGTYTASDEKTKDGAFTYFSDKGNKESECIYVNNLKEGLATEYFEKGSKSDEGNYLYDQKTGEWKSYYEEGELWSVAHFEKGNCIDLKSFYKSGKLKRTETYHKAKAKGKCYDEQSNEIEFTQFITPPKPKFSIHEYLGYNIVYPNYARMHDIEGRVVVRFVINENGSVSDVKAIKHIGGACDEEAIRVITNMPGWEAGIKDDKKVKVFFTQPISFKLQ